MLVFGLLDVTLSASGLSAFGPFLANALIAYGSLSPGGVLALLWLCAGAGWSRVRPRLPLCLTDYRIGSLLSRVVMPSVLRATRRAPAGYLSAVAAPGLAAAFAASVGSILA